MHMLSKIAVIGAVIESPDKNQEKFNHILSEFKGIIKGRMGIPFPKEEISVISITVVGSLDEINSLTGKLGTIPSVVVKTSISKREIHEPIH